MLHEYTEDSEAVGRFLQEAFVASAVDHPNVVEIWAADRFEEDGRMYILMPLIEGTSLEALCDHVGPLGLDAAATIAIQIAAGLDAVHELGVVHRDIKPANLLITKKRGLKHLLREDRGLRRRPPARAAPRGDLARAPDADEHGDRHRREHGTGAGSGIARHRRAGRHL
jgi:serine/threonine protein kinase